MSVDFSCSFDQYWSGLSLNWTEWSASSGGGGYLIIFPCCWKLTITPSECCHHQAAISHLSLVKLQFLCCDNSKNSPEQMVHIVMVSCVHQNHIRFYNSITDSDENYFPKKSQKYFPVWSKIFPCQYVYGCGCWQAAGAGLSGNVIVCSVMCKELFIQRYFTCIWAALSNKTTLSHHMLRGFIRFLKVSVVF